MGSHRVRYDRSDLAAATAVEMLKNYLYQFFSSKLLKEMGIPDHLTCLLRNLYAGQEATVRTGHGTNRKRSTSRLYIVTVLI